MLCEVSRGGFIPRIAMVSFQGLFFLSCVLRRVATFRKIFNKHEVNSRVGDDIKLRRCGQVNCCR